MSCDESRPLKDAWDAESEEEKDDDSQKEETVVKVKKKKTLAQKIAEKEEAAAKALEERLAREAEEKELNTPQGMLIIQNMTFCKGKLKRAENNTFFFREARREAEIAKDTGGKRPEAGCRYVGSRWQQWRSH